MSILLNHEPYPYTEGMTLQTLKEAKGFVFADIIAKVNGQIIRDNQWAATILQDGDQVEMIHVFGGG